ncbi:hypothetical protein B0H10DRAFT_1860001, partial [Mycena sp. CBHHK59/15]
RDISHENVVLLNRDALFYIEFVAAIKKGDIGRVVNVLQIWMVMMRSPKTMPRYADAIFETLRRIDRYDPLLKRYFLHNWLVNLTGRPYSFKEVDLLQEHQNFWAKRHTVPDMSKEVQTLADALKDEKLQEYVLNRPANDATDSTAVTPVRDLLEEGAKYADTRGAFKKFTKEARRAENLGFVDSPVADSMNDSGDGEASGMEEDYEVTGDDLGIDDEEPYADAAALLATATEVVSHYM